MIEEKIFFPLHFDKPQSTGTGPLRRTSNFMSAVDSKRVNSSAESTNRGCCGDNQWGMQHG